MKAYYNDIDPAVCAWVRELMKDGLVMDGVVDERPIEQITGADLEGFTRVHLFCGIAGWERALQLADWPVDRPVWTGSCPCQSFSAAGKRKGHGDARNLWPEMLRLIRECRPATIFGEQVEAAIGFGWLDGVFVDLEEQAYACGPAVLPAACVGAPHIRQRIWWCARNLADAEHRRPTIEEQRPKSRAQIGGVAFELANAEVNRASAHEQARQPNAQRRTSTESLPHPQRDGGRLDEQERAAQGRVADGRDGAGMPVDGMGDSARATRTRFGRDGAEVLPVETAGGGRTSSARMQHRFWDDFALVACKDGKYRRTQPGIFPLADGIPGRVGILRGAGNAIVPQVAAEFIAAYLEASEGVTAK